MFENAKSWWNQIIGEGHEVTDSIREALEERLISPFYGYFFISWIIVNWDYVYSALFVNGDLIFKKTGLLKNEYLLQEILPPHYNFPWYWLDFLVLPFLLTFIAFWLMPYVTRFFFRKHIKNRIRNEQIRSYELAAGKEAEARVVEAETSVLKAEVEKAKIVDEAKSIDPSISWKREYEQFTKHTSFSKFQQIIDSVYKHNGLIKSMWSGTLNRFRFMVETEILVYADINNLIVRNQESEKIELTEKGKAFVRYFTNEHVG